MGFAFVSCDHPAPPLDTRRIEVNADAAVTLREGFETGLTDWELVEGAWEGRGSGNAAVLVQTSTDRTFPVALWKRRPFAGPSSVGAFGKHEPASCTPASVLLPPSCV